MKKNKRMILYDRLAGALENDNPSWDTERVFQEARRILTAEWQHIIYGEWLPILLGKRKQQDWAWALTNLFDTSLFSFQCPTKVS